MSQDFVKKTTKSLFPYKAVNARDSGGLYARDRGCVADNNRLLSRTSAVVARVSREQCNRICYPQVVSYWLLWHRVRPNSKRSMVSHSVLPTSIPFMTVAWFAVLGISQSGEAGYWDYDRKTKVNLIGGVGRAGRFEVHFVRY